MNATMKIVAATLGLLAFSTSSAAADSVTGRVRQVSNIPVARGNSGDLHVQINEVLFNGATVAAVVCSNAGTNYYHAYLPASANGEQRHMMQALLTASMLAEKIVTVFTSWNGSYCEITSVQYKG